MGMPLGKYGMLSQHIDTLKYDKVMQDMYKTFKFYAIIIHDINDLVLRNYLMQEFGHLHNMTGEHMLFISWIDAPQDWNFGKHSYMFDPNIFPVVENAYEGEAEMFLLRALLHLPQEGSFLILTRSLLELNPDDILLCSTSRNLIKGQLEIIANFSYDHRNDESISDETFVELKEKLDHQPLNIASIHEILLDVFSLSNRFEGDQVIYKSQRRQNDVVQRLFSNVSNKLQNEEDAAEEILRLYLAKALMMMTLDYEQQDFRQMHRRCTHHGHVSMEDLLRMRNCNDWHNHMSMTGFMFKGMHQVEDENNHYLDLLDPTSRFYYKTYCILRPIFGGENLDKSALVIYLAKILEREGNLSIYQYCRMMNGIHMPRYFDKPCDNKNGFLQIHVDDKNVLINEYHHKEIGALGIILLWMQRNGYDYPLMDDLRSLWEYMRTQRNDAAHNRIITNVHETERIWKSIMNNHFVLFNQLKTECQQDEREPSR